MQNECKNCRHRGWETMADVGSCNCCDNGEFFSPDMPSGYHNFVNAEPFILEREDWTYEEWKTLCKLVNISCGKAERIVIHANRVECFICSDEQTGRR